MRVNELMSTDVQTAAPNDAAEDAWRRMKQDRIRHLVVLSRREVVGLIPEPELGGETGASIRAGKTVGELMSPRVVTVLPDTTANRAANLLRAKQVLCLPVVDRGSLVGLVTASDLLEQLGRGHGNKARPLPRIRSSRPSSHVGRR